MFKNIPPEIQDTFIILKTLRPREVNGCTRAFAYIPGTHVHAQRPFCWMPFDTW